MNLGDKEFNVTYNVSEMFYKHNHEGIRYHYGKTGKEAIPLLLDMYSFFLLNKNFLETLNPQNEWGSWESSTEVIHQMLLASASYADEIWEGD